MQAMPSLYNDPVQMEPLFIERSRPLHAPLLGLAHELSEASACLDAGLNPLTAGSLADLVAGMNCYYSNLIEGQRTLPVDIEQALRDVRKPDQQRLKSLALAHVATDKWARTQPLDRQALRSFIEATHRRFCDDLPDELLRLDDGTLIEPGRIRQRDVRVGYHVAPAWQTLDAFLGRFVEAYGKSLEGAQQGGANKLDAIVASCCAHHRFVWIHPFLDGNGRVARILFDAMLRASGLNGAALWSMSRGFAKTVDDYMRCVAEADHPRMGNLDGRGNLSEKRLFEFCEYALRTAIDQARYMAGIFDLGKIAQRAQGYFQQVRFDLKGREAWELFMRAYVYGEFERGEAGRITGLAERTARELLNTLCDEGFLESETPKGKVRAGFPVHALGSLLPNLYPAGDLDVDIEKFKAERRHLRLR